MLLPYGPLSWALLTENFSKPNKTQHYDYYHLITGEDHLHKNTLILPVKDDDVQTILPWTTPANLPLSYALLSEPATQRHMRKCLANLTEMIPIEAAIFLNLEKTNKVNK